MSSKNRPWLLHLYRVGIGLTGVLILFFLSPAIPWQRASASLLLFALFSLVVKRAGFHIAPNVTHSLVGIVDAAVLLLFGSTAGALVATASCLIYLLLYTWRHQTPATRVDMLEIALFSSGLKALIALGAGAVYRLAGGSTLTEIGVRDLWPLLTLFVTWFALDHLGWGLHELLGGGPEQVWRFVRTIWSTSLLVEFFPLWAAVIIVYVYNQGNMLVFWLLALGLIAVSLVVQRLSDMWERLQRRLTELTALNEIGRAIVSAQLDEDDLCELIYQQASKIVDTAWFHLGLFDGQDYDLKISIQDHLCQPAQRFAGAADEGIIGWMRHSRQPLLVHDFQREMNALPARPSYNSERPPRSGVYVPLLAGDKVIGTLSIQSTQTSAFTQNHLRLLSVIGNQAALAIEQVRMYQLEQRRVRQLTLIESVGRKVTSILELDTLFNEVVRLVQETFGYYHVSILSLNAEGNEVKFEAGTNSDVRHADIRVPLGQGIVGWVAAHGEPLLVNDVDADTRFIHHQALSDTRAELAVPLTVEGRVLGVLDVQSDRRNAFGQDDLFILQTLASQIAIAIEDARLYAAQQEEAWMTTALYQVAEATSRLSSLSDVLATVVRLTPILTGVDRCAILLWDKITRTFTPVQAYGVDEAQYARLVTLHLAEQDVPALVKACQSRQPLLLPSSEVSTALARSLIELFNLQNLLVLPLIARGEALGTMIVDYADGAFATSRKIEIITGIANQVAIAIENAQLYTAQQEEAYVSTALLQVAEAVRSLTELDDILSAIVRITPLLIGVNMCAILVRSEETFSLSQSFGFDETEIEAVRRAFLDGQLVYVLRKGRPVLSLTAESPAYAWNNDVTVINNELDMVILPLMAKGNLLGAMVVDYAEMPIHMVERWFNILSGIADQAAIAIENTYLYRQETERKRLQHELEMAREIQASFLPQAYPSLPGWQIDALWQSASQVGGDFYDMFMLPDGRWGLVIADVADKGVPAALFMALSRTLIRVVARQALSPADTLGRTNDLIISDTHSDLFVTAFYLILDPQSGEIVYANGGHNPPLLVRHDGRVESLRARGIVLGIISPIHLEEKRLRMEPGDLLVMYTDGVTDAINEQEEEFGSGRLAEAILSVRTEASNQVIDEIRAQVMAFAGTMPQFDDLTLVVLKRE